ncbi:MAG: M67 family metallopeptidase [Bacteroidota bacterium]
MLNIEQVPLDQMVKDAVRTFPDECCGFLFGKDEENIRTVIKIQVVDNAKEGDKRRRFVISGKDYLRAEQFAEENNLLLIGVYHSHPNHPAIPSEHDRVAAQPYFSYIILSVMNNEFDHIRSWRLNAEQQFEEEKILIQQLN